MLIVNCLLSHCRHPLLGQQHPAPCLPARTVQVVSVSTACGLFHSAVDPVVIYVPPITQHICIGHTANGVLTTCQSHSGVGGGSTYTRVLNFGCFFSLEVRGSTYVRIALYAGVYGTLMHSLKSVYVGVAFVMCTLIRVCA